MSGSALKVREVGILPFTPAADYSAKEGYSVTLSGETATLSASATTRAPGIILEGGVDANDQVSVGILGAIGGTYRVKLSGAVTKGDRLQQAADGTWLTDAGSGSRVVGPIALETGVSGDLIEVADQPLQVLS
jgi:hypothetical protein